jgi:O-Antigen ligase
MEEKRMSAGSAIFATRQDVAWHPPAFANLSLFLLFFGQGLAITVPYFVQRFNPPTPDWMVSRFGLLTTLPALVVGFRYYFSYAGIAKSAALLTALSWMGLSLLWVDSTEVGRGQLILTNMAVTLPLAAVVARTGLHQQCALWFCEAFVSSMLLAIGSGMESVDDRLGDVYEGDAVVMNSNGLGLTALFVLLLIYLIYEQQHRCVPVQGTSRGAPRRRLLPLLALGALAMCLLSVSRTVAVALGILFLMVLSWHCARGSALAVRVLLGLVLLLGILFALDLQSAWVERFTDQDMTSLNGRTDIWSSGGYLMGQMNIGSLWGLGMGGADKFLGVAMGEGVVHPIDGILRCHSHSMYVDWFLELGVVGLVLGLWLGLHLLRVAWQLDRQDGAIYRHALLAYFVIFGVVGVPFKAEAWPAMGTLLWAALTPRANRKGRP